MPDPNDQNNQDQPPVQPVFADPTQMGNVVPPPANAAPPSTQTTVDVTAGNQTTVAVASPETTTTVSMKPTRGKIGPKGIIATVFGILLLAGAVVAGTTLVQQNQDIREKASGGDCALFLGQPCTSDGSCVDSAGQTCNLECKVGSSGSLQFSSNPTGCVPAPTTTPTGCTSNSDCGPGQFCYSGTCGVDSTSTDVFVGLGESCGGKTSDQKTIKCRTDLFCSGGTCVPGNANDPNQSCKLYLKYSCPGMTDGSGGCQNGSGERSTSKPNLDANFCGIQQIDCCTSDDCANSRFIESSSYDASKCGSTNNPPPPPKSDCPSPGSCWDPNTRKCDIDKNNPDCSPIGNCGGAGLESGGSCGGGQICCRPKGTSNPKPRCLGIGIQVKVNNAFVKATTELVSALKAGDVIRLTASGGGTDLGTSDCRFDKARFAINGAAPVETTAVNRAKDRFGRDRCTYYYDYTIPAGVTRFSFDGDVHYGPSNVWK